MLKYSYYRNTKIFVIPLLIRDKIKILIPGNLHALFWTLHPKNISFWKKNIFMLFSIALNGQIFFILAWIALLPPTAFHRKRLYMSGVLTPFTYL